MGILLIAMALGTAPAAPADEFQTSAGALKIRPIQHASLLIEVPGQALYVDPAQGNYDGLPQADLVVFTHGHGDHVNAEILEKLRKPGTQIVATEAVAKSVAGAIVMRNGETRTLGKWTIEAVAAYNAKRKRPDGGFFHPKGEGNAYVLTYGGTRILIAGDTEDVPELRALKNIAVAFIPMNLPYTMTPEEAAALVRAIKPKVVYPYHSRGSDLTAFEKALAGSGVEVRLRNWY